MNVALGAQAPLSRTLERGGAAEAERRSSGSSIACAARKGVRIQGVDGLMVRYAQCCQPVPGDPVVGYVTRGRGVSIHRADCPNLLLLAHEPERRLEIDWQEAAGRAVPRAARARGRTTAAGSTPTSPPRSSSRAPTSAAWSSRAPTAGRTGSLLVEVENLAHLEKIIKAARKVKGITDVARRERITQDG